MTEFMQIMGMLPSIMLALLSYGLMFFVLWKFYELLTKISDNLAGIRRAIEANTPPPAASYRPPEL